MQLVLKYTLAYFNGKDLDTAARFTFEHCRGDKREVLTGVTEQLYEKGTILRRNHLQFNVEYVI
jgi:hypothetical protein